MERTYSDMENVFMLYINIYKFIVNNLNHFNRLFTKIARLDLTVCAIKSL